MNVIIVIVINEVVSKGLAEDDPDQDHKQNTDQTGHEPLTSIGRRRAITRNAFWIFFPPDRIAHFEQEIKNKMSANWPQTRRLPGSRRYR
jgi:hypothetical protein